LHGKLGGGGVSIFGCVIGLVVDYLIGFTGGYLLEKGSNYFLLLVACLIAVAVFGLVTIDMNNITVSALDILYGILCFISTWIGLETGSRVAKKRNSE